MKIGKKFMKMKLVIFLNKNKVNISTFFFLLALSFISFLFSKTNLDERVILSGAWHLLNGRVLYIDFFEKIAPGSFYLIYWVFKIFGAKYSIAKIVSIIMLATASFTIYKSSQIVTKSKLSLIPAIIFILSLSFLPIINHNFYSIVFIIISVYFFLLYNKTKGNYSIFIAGLFSGLAIVFLQHKGLIFWGGVGLILLFNLIKLKTKKSFQNLLYFSAGSIIPIIPILIKWPLKTLYSNLFLSPLSGYIEVNKMPYYLFFAFLIITFYFAIALWSKKDIIIKNLLFLQLLLILSCFALPDFYHLALISFPILILSPNLILERPLKINWTIIIIIYLLLCSVFIKSFIDKSLFFYTNNLIETLSPIIEQNCSGKYIYSGPFAPLYLDFKKINATPFSVLLETEFSPVQFDEALESFKTNSPNCAILLYYDNITKHFGHTGNNVLENYIRESYQPIFTKDFITIYKKQ